MTAFRRLKAPCVQAGRVLCRMHGVFGVGGEKLCLAYGNMYVRHPTEFLRADCSLGRGSESISSCVLRRHWSTNYATGDFVAKAFAVGKTVKRQN